MDVYRCSESNIPDNLYRVHYPGSRTSFSGAEGFSASDMTKVYNSNEIDDFKKAIVNQFTWKCRDSLPFVALFSNREHAENWGLKEPWHDGLGDDWSLHVIDTTRLRNTKHFFKLQDLVRVLHLELPVGASQHISGTFLCLHGVPMEAIICKRSPGEVKADQEDRLQQQYYETPEFDYLSEHSDSEREAMQENYNTIFERNMEDNW